MSLVFNQKKTPTTLNPMIPKKCERLLHWTFFMKSMPSTQLTSSAMDQSYSPISASHKDLDYHIQRAGWTLLSCRVFQEKCSQMSIKVFPMHSLGMFNSRWQKYSSKLPSLCYYTDSLNRLSQPHATSRLPFGRPRYRFFQIR